LTFKKKTSLIVSSLKGNTIGILEKLDGDYFDYVHQIKRKNKEDLTHVWDESKIIFIGTSTYSSKFRDEVEYPAQMRTYRDSIESLKGKDIILFGSGRSEYPNFCGALDYLENALQVDNNILLKYKFEGYPKEKQKEEFKQKVERIMNNEVSKI